MKRCFLSSLSAALKRDFQDVHSKNLLALRYILSKYVDITSSLTLQRKSFNFSHYVALIKPRSPKPSGAFFCYCFPSLFTCHFPDILRPCDRKVRFFASEHVQGVAEVWNKCHRTKAKSRFFKRCEFAIIIIGLCAKSA